MRQEIDPKESKRAEAYNLWMKSPMPMVTLTKTFDIARIYRKSKKKGIADKRLSKSGKGQMKKGSEELCGNPVK